MTPEAILEQPAQVLSEEQRRRYFEQGFVLLEGFLSSAELAPIDWAQGMPARRRAS